LKTPLNERRMLSEKLLELRRATSEDVTDNFLRRHPDWLDKYGSKARLRGIEDAVFHIEFLASAIESGSPVSFEEYCRWTIGMLNSRGIESHFVAENLQQIEDSLSPNLAETDREILKEFVSAGVRVCSQDLPVSIAKEPDTPLSETQRLYLTAILKGQRLAAANIALEAGRQGHSTADIYADVLQESLYQVGKKWAANQITVAEEHMATAITQYVISQLYAQFKPSDIRRGNLVITGVHNEMHQIGANMVADVLESDGWDVRFLGTNLPHSGILQAIEEHAADVLGISATMLFNLPQAIRLIKEVRDRMKEHSPRIILGGSAFRSVPTLWREIGADGFGADVREARALLGVLTV
jgi:methanogenic corrinoid protein MtbC1